MGFCFKLKKTQFLHLLRASKSSNRQICLKTPIFLVILACLAIFFIKKVKNISIWVFIWPKVVKFWAETVECLHFSNFVEHIKWRVLGNHRNISSLIDFLYLALGFCRDSLKFEHKWHFSKCFIHIHVGTSSNSVF